MSRATVQKLELLLARVQERRGLPREPVLVAGEARITQAPDQPFSTPPPSTGRVSKVPAPTPLEESMESLVPVQRPRETQPSPFEAAKPVAQPDSDELFLDDFEPPPTIAPAAMTAARAPAAPIATYRPEAAAAAPAAPAPAAPAPITAPTARITPAAVASASPVAAVSKARSIEPKNFGELLDLSLALRPSK